MPADGHVPELAVRWLEHARADLALASVALPPGGMYEHLCFHAHQAVEKSLKAVLLAMGVDFPFTHNLQALLDRLPASLDIPPEVSESVALMPYAVTTRYPGETEPVTAEDHDTAVRLAAAAHAWASSVVLGPASS